MLDLGVGRIYFNFTPAGAIALMDSLTQQLNAASYSFYAFRFSTIPLHMGVMIRVTLL